MSTNFTNFLIKLNNLIDDNLNGTTTKAGNAAGLTLIDSGLAKYDDGWFGDPARNSQWWAYIEANTTLTTVVYDDDDTSIEVVAYTVFSANDVYARWEDEIITLSDRSASPMTVIRGELGSTAVSHTAGTSITEIPAASQLRPIKMSQGSSGTIEVFTAFTAQIAISKAYSLHKFDRDKKFVACNQALNDAYPYFYKRVEDETTLDGLGASDNEYEVPSTFTEFPDQIWKKHTTGTVITYTPITKFVATEVSDTRYFYADITIDDDILLVGKTYLSQFTTDTSTTELLDGQADVVAMLAASILYRNLSGLVNAADSGRFDSLAGRYEAMYEAKKIKAAMPRITQEKLDYGWLNE